MTQIRDPDPAAYWRDVEARLARTQRRTTVVNLRREPYDVYIGRPGKGLAGPFGNPFRVPHGASRMALADILVEYRDYLIERVENEPDFRAACLALRGKRLGCFCKPGPCHGDILARWVDAQFADEPGASVEAGPQGDLFAGRTTR